MLPVSVVIPFCRGDKDQAVRLLRWIAELGKVDARCYLIGPEACAPSGLLSLAYKAFSEAAAWIDYEDIQCNWQHKDIDMLKSAVGPNSIFRQVAWNMNLQGLGPWLFLEPDSVPVAPDWMEQLCAEYVSCKKSFMGDRVDESTHPGKIGLTLHMSGVAIYPQKVPALAPEAIRPSDVAFDMQGASQIVPQCHFSELIDHRFRAESFHSQADVERRIDKRVVLFHASKDGSLIERIREKISGNAPVVQLAESPGLKPVECGFGSRPGQPVCDIFIKTYPEDYEWLKYCMRSIDKFCTGFRRIAMMSPYKDCPRPEPMVKRDHLFVLGVDSDRDPGYLWQQSVKLHADQHTDADFIIFADSDCVFTKPVTPADFIRDGKPVWVMKPMSEAREDERKAWAPVIEKFMGHYPERHMMVRHPFIVPRSVLPEMRQFCKYRHGVELSDYIMAQAVPGQPLALTFSEWQCLGAFAFEHQHDKFTWVHEKDAGEPCVHQEWSHGGLTDAIRAKLEQILKGGDAQWPPSVLSVGNSTGTENVVVRDGAETVQPASAPMPVSFAIATLAAEAQKGNINKARVVAQLVKAGIVPPRPMKKRKVKA
jgi:hypothetical protein